VRNDAFGKNHIFVPGPGSICSSLTGASPVSFERNPIWFQPLHPLAALDRFGTIGLLNWCRFRLFNLPLCSVIESFVSLDSAL
jgi:hypothetical protein